MSVSTSTNQEILATLERLKRYFICVGAFSAGVNLLMLVPIIYMLQIYDRVITSGSLSTLSMLTLLLILLIAALGALEWVRSVIMVGIGSRIDRDLRPRIADANFRHALAQGGGSAQPFHDLTSLRQFLTSNGTFAFFDAPWFPVYVLIMFLFHPWFGVVAILGGLIMLALAFLNERSTGDAVREANGVSGVALNRINNTLRNAESIQAMGMADNVHRRQNEVLDQAIDLQAEASRRAGFWGSTSKSFRILMQSLVLGLGAYLALHQEISPGMMIAGSLLLGRALAPIDQLVGAWRGFSVARAQYDRLNDLLASMPAAARPMSLPEPKGALSAENISIVPPGATLPSIISVSMSLEAGESMSVVGPSASGKSSLLRGLLGIWPVTSGVVRIDGADIRHWDRAQLGRFVGYVPQDIELLDGSISENICRFGEVDADKVIEAAHTAGVHDLILRLPDGYDTVLGHGGTSLSGGQRQSIALARAVYDKPRLIVLDEPNSNLDEQGERELVRALGRIKETGATLLIVTHRPALLTAVDRIQVMNEGRIVGTGTRDEILPRLSAMRPMPSREQKPPVEQPPSKKSGGR